MRDVPEVDVRVDGTLLRQAVRLSIHACQRWHERAQPGVSAPAATRGMRHALREHGVLVSMPPSWVGTSPGTRLYVVVGDFVLPVELTADHTPLAVTVVARGGISHAERRARRTRRHARRAGSQQRHHRPADARHPSRFQEAI